MGIACGARRQIWCTTTCAPRLAWQLVAGLFKLRAAVVLRVHPMTRSPLIIWTVESSHINVTSFWRRPNVNKTPEATQESRRACHSWALCTPISQHALAENASRSSICYNGSDLPSVIAAIRSSLSHDSAWGYMNPVCHSSIADPAKVGSVSWRAAHSLCGGIRERGGSITAAQGSGAATSQVSGKGSCIEGAGLGIAMPVRKTSLINPLRNPTAHSLETTHKGAQP